MGLSPLVPGIQWSSYKIRSEIRGRTAGFQKPCSVLGRVRGGLIDNCVSGVGSGVGDAEADLGQCVIAVGLIS